MELISCEDELGNGAGGGGGGGGGGVDAGGGAESAVDLGATFGEQPNPTTSKRNGIKNFLNIRR
jgi:hypothetical protein